MPNSELTSIRRKKHLRALAAVVMAAVAVGLGIAWWRSRPERHLRYAERALNEGDIEGAGSWLALPERETSTRDRAYLLRVRAALMRGDLKSAVRVLDKINPKGPQAADFAFWKGRTLYEARQPFLAMIWFRRALDRTPGNVDAHRWLAAAAYDIGDRSTVLSALRSVARLDPGDSRVWRTLGMVFKENVDYEEARDAFRRCLALAPNEDEVRIELAEVLLKLGDAAGAESLVRDPRGHALESRRLEILAESFSLRGMLSEFRKTVEQGLALDPDAPGLLAQRAQLDLRDGHPAEALERLDRAVAADPYRVQTLYQRGVVLRQLGRTEEARRDANRAAELSRAIEEMARLNDQAAQVPDDADVRYRIGEICVRLGRTELAASWYRAALACNPRHAAARLGLLALRPRSQPGNGSP